MDNKCHICDSIISENFNEHMLKCYAIEFSESKLNKKYNYLSQDEKYKRIRMLNNLPDIIKFEDIDILNNNYSVDEKNNALNYIMSDDFINKLLDLNKK